MTRRTRLTLLTVLAVGWFVLAGANFARHRWVVGVAYVICGVVISALTLRFGKGRRAR